MRERLSNLHSQRWVDHGRNKLRPYGIGEAAAELAAEAVPALVLDMEAGFVRAGRAHSLAGALAAECLALEDLSADTLVLKLRQRR